MLVAAFALGTEAFGLIGVRLAELVATALRRRIIRRPARLAARATSARQTVIAHCVFGALVTAAAAAIANTRGGCDAIFAENS